VTAEAATALKVAASVAKKLVGDTLAYKLRQMDANMNAQFQRVRDAIDRSTTGADPIDPDVLLAGPLRGLGLLDEYRRIGEPQGVGSRGRRVGAGRSN